MGIVSIPAEAEGKVLAIRAHLGASDGLEIRLVVDTGAGTSALSLGCAERHGLPVRSGLRVRTPTGLTSVGAFLIPRLRIGPLEVSNLRLAAVPLPNDRVDGLLGLDFFRAVGAASVTFRLHDRRIDVQLA
ncbi:MAG TPA: retropepsin-like aspartic protease [Chloroflexota bacterium]|nr:retropepsin-like aspartic protease [Chloroflexota bacterium]